MPIHNQSYHDLADEGPTLPVTVGVTQAHSQLLQRLSMPEPTPVSGTALIDTGASLCMIDERVLQSLSIPPLGAIDIVTPAGASQQLTYPASLSFPGTEIPNIAFADFVSGPLAGQGFIAIIGRNVLRGFVLHYNGPANQITLAH